MTCGDSNGFPGFPPVPISWETERSSPISWGTRNRGCSYFLRNSEVSPQQEIVVNKPLRFVHYYFLPLSRLPTTCTETATSAESGETAGWWEIERAAKRGRGNQGQPLHKTQVPGSPKMGSLQKLREAADAMGWSVDETLTRVSGTDHNPNFKYDFRLWGRAVAWESVGKVSHLRRKRFHIYDILILLYYLKVSSSSNLRPHTLVS